MTGSNRPGRQGLQGLTEGAIGYGMGASLALLNLAAQALASAETMDAGQAAILAYQAGIVGNGVYSLGRIALLERIQNRLARNAPTAVGVQASSTLDYESGRELSRTLWRIAAIAPAGALTLAISLAF